VGELSLKGPDFARLWTRHEVRAKTAETKHLNHPVVGELSLLDHGPRTATVTCDTDCKVFVISQRHFLAVLACAS